MSRILFFLVWFLLVASWSCGQNTYVEVEIFMSDGEVLKGDVDSRFVRRPSFKLFLVDGTLMVSHSKIDSIHSLGNRYVVFHEKGHQARLLKIIDEGRVNLYEYNGKNLAVKRDGTKLYHILLNDFTEAYAVFCQDSLDAKIEGMTRESFIEGVKQFNAEHENKAVSVNYDWMKSYAKQVSVRLSILSPSAGVELKISESVSIYSGARINMLGDVLREAQTFLNYDIEAEMRYFFRKKARLLKGKSNYNFSGSYLGASYNYFIDSSKDNSHVLGLGYGWQESNIIGHTYQKVKIGVGVDVNTGDVMLLTGFSMGLYF